MDKPSDHRRPSARPERERNSDMEYPEPAGFANQPSPRTGNRKRMSLGQSESQGDQHGGRAGDVEPHAFPRFDHEPASHRAGPPDEGKQGYRGRHDRNPVGSER